MSSTLNLGKMFRRAVQRADQGLGRVDKSEVLTDEIQAMERQLDTLRQAYQNTVKRIQLCLPPLADPEKRLRKLPESLLSSSLSESAASLSQTHSVVFSKTFSICAEAEQVLADSLVQHAVETEKVVLQPLSSVTDEIQSIMKLRRQLTNMTLDMDSAKKVYNAMQRQTQGPPSKVDSAREEMEAAEMKVDQCKDQLVTEMYQLFAREEELCQLLVSFLQVQADYHRRSLELLDRQIRQMNEEIEQLAVRPFYKCDLKEHLAYVKQDIATVIDVSIQSILRQGLKTEGIFRIAPSASKLRKLTSAFDANITDIDDEDFDVHCLAGALKLYLRELPEPLMTFELFDDWAAASQRPGHEKLNALMAVVNKLPKQNYDNLRYLIKFLAKITEYSESNRMTASNLAIVVAPNLIWPSKQEKGSMQSAGVAYSAVETLISNSNWFFPDDISPLPTTTTTSNPCEEENYDVNKRSEDASMTVKNKSNRLDKPHGGKLKKAPAPTPPTPPLKSFEQERSEATLEFEEETTDSRASPKHKEASVTSQEQLKSSPTPAAVGTVQGKSLPPPRPIKKSGKKSAEDKEEEHAGDRVKAASGEGVEMADALIDNQVQPNSRLDSLNRLKKFQTVDVLDAGDSALDTSFERIGDGPETPEVFSPVPGIGPDVDALADRSAGSFNGRTVSTEPVYSPFTNSAAVNLSIGSNFHNETKTTTGGDIPIKDKMEKSKTPSGPSPVTMRKTSITDSSSKSSPPSPGVRFTKSFRSLDIFAKSATLPNQKTAPVELCHMVKLDSSDTDISPKSKGSISSEPIKSRPQPAPRLSRKDSSRGEVDWEERQEMVSTAENTHL